MENAVPFASRLFSVSRVHQKAREDCNSTLRFHSLIRELIEGDAGGDRRVQRVDEGARIIVLDQFPRNMFRGTPRAFATDGLALAAARHAIANGYDRDWLRVEKIFAYLPFEHSEALADQERACELMRPLGEEQYDYALRHYKIIERFGRFPHRNAILGRASTAEEIEFLKQPGSGF
jgi:uncharacterized protein (DUF924 family)